MINFNEIIGPIELAIVKWAQHYPLTSPVKTLQDLTNGELLIFFLKKVTYFQFVQPQTYSSFEELTLSEKIGRMKLIGRSITTYYKREIMKEIGGGNFNYLEMCTGNKEELMRMVILFMGIIAANFDVLKQIEDYMNTSEEDSVAYMKIIVDYAKKLSQNDQEDNDSPLKKQKRLITKLEILEEQIQYYEEYTKQLQAKVEKLAQEAGKYHLTIKEHNANSSEMLKRIDQLQANNEELLKQIAKKASNQQLLNAKLTKNRQLADQSIAKLIQDIDKQKQDTIYYKKLVLKYEYVEALNKQLTTFNSDLSKQLMLLKGKYEKNIENLHKMQLQLENMNKINSQISLENDSLKLKIELIEKSFTNNRSIHFSPQQKSIVVHNPLDISTTSNNNNFAWFNFKEKEMDFNNQLRMGDSLTLTLKSNQSFVENRMNLMNVQESKQNNINYANLPSVPQSQCSLNGIAQQKSFEIDMQHFNSLMKLKEQRDLEFSFLIQMVTQMYDYMQSLRKQLNKYQLKEAKQLQRATKFKQKVNTMFA